MTKRLAVADLFQFDDPCMSAPLAGVVTLEEAGLLVGRQARTIKFKCWRGEINHRVSVGGHYMVDLESLKLAYPDCFPQEVK